MPIYRTEKSKDYVVMSNVFLQRKDLSIKAKGLLAYMLSLPDDWKFTIGGLTFQLKECKSAVAAMLDELVSAGTVMPAALASRSNGMLPTKWSSRIAAISA